MSTEKAKTEEVVLLSEEQIGKFPELKSSLELLTEGMNIGELKEFNPLVSELLEIEKVSEILKLIPIDDEGNFNNINIECFMDQKKLIRGYRSKLNKVTKALKDPRIAQNKAINTIKDFFKTKADTLFDNLEAEFKPYVDEQDRIKKERQAKKDEAFQKKIDEAQEKASEEVEKNKRIKAYNEIKYEKIADGITAATQSSILELNENKLTEFKEKIQSQKYYDLTINVENYDLLGEELIAELKESFTKSTNSAIALIDEKLKSLKTEREKMILESAKGPDNAVDDLKQSAEKIDEVIPPVAPPPPGVEKHRVVPTNGITMVELNDADFCQYLEKEARKLSDIISSRINAGIVCSPRVYSIKTILENINK